MQALEEEWIKRVKENRDPFTGIPESDKEINKPKKPYLCALCDGVPCHKDCEDCEK